ncbi:PDR/VanB family oxidoreductase [Variovorax ureilyticus]|uniref:PDR/VanB family oxidoreductase n=1 Tax=Variovorax ureilyticus TaxID=1836198 RepID=A0ABU8V9H6_9BURK
MTKESAGHLRVRVAAKQEEAREIVSFELVPCDGESLPAFAAGAHIDVHVGDGLVRQYSLCNDPSETHRYLIAVLKEPSSRGGSKAMHETIEVGVSLMISEPKNHFQLAAGAGRHLLLAGGIGVTPILCMAESLAAQGAEFEMHFCTRSAERTAFRGRIAKSRFAGSVHFHSDDCLVGQRFDIQGRLACPQPREHLYVCGPKGFMDAVLSAARANGWPESQLHYEFFANELGQSSGDQGFEVELARSGRVIAVRKDQTALQALMDAGIEVESSCEQGVCGTCATRVISGIPDHRDLYFTSEEHAANDQFTPCCSRARSDRLVLDL